MKKLIVGIFLILGVFGCSNDVQTSQDIGKKIGEIEYTRIYEFKTSRGDFCVYSSRGVKHGSLQCDFSKEK